MATPELGRLYQGIAKDSAAFKLMQQMGWQEGRGLGKDQQGIATHVRVSKKQDTSGLGIAEAKKEASNWTVNTAVFDQILKNLNVKAREGGGDGAACEVGAAAAGGAEIPSQNSGKGGKRGTSQTDGPKQEQAQPPAQRAHTPPPHSASTSSKLARPQGRYKKREAGKCVKSYSDSDLSAILGVPHFPTPPLPALPMPKSGSAEEGGTGESKEEREKEKKGKRKRGEGEAGGTDVDEGTKRLKGKMVNGETKSRDEKKPGKAVKGEKGTQASREREREEKRAQERKAERCSQSAAPLESVEQTPLPADWWGHRCGFVRAGTLGAAAPKKAEEERGFCEQDQEDLYHLVNNTATSGKKGLGVGSQPKKVAGARWQGQKKAFAEEDSEEGSGEAASCAGEEQQGAGVAGEQGTRAGDKDQGIGSPTQHSPLARADSEGALSDEEGVGGARQEQREAEKGPSLLKAIKWKKLIVGALKKRPKGMLVEEVKEEVVAQALLSLPLSVCHQRLHRLIHKKMSRLHGSVVVIEGSMVRHVTVASS